MQILLPCEDQYLRTSATQRPTYNVSRYDRLLTSVEREVVSLFEKEINFHVKIERSKRDLALRYDWTARAAFETVDSLRDYVLTHRSIQSFLRTNGFVATDGEVIAIIRRLDSDGDNKITLEEFIDGVRYTVSISPIPAIATLPISYEESKRPSSPLRRSAASPLRQTEIAAALSHSRTSYGGSGAFIAPSSPSRTATYYVPSSPSRTATYYAPLTRTEELLARSPSRRYSPLKSTDENELVRAFKEQIALENELEDAKNRLALQTDFNLPDAFDLIDRHLLGNLTSGDLSDSLASNGVYAVSEDVQLFVKRYDRNLDGRLNYNEFSEAFMPKSASYSTSL
jgi:Ca2+-binding EF-hand superfamily protein